MQRKREALHAGGVNQIQWAKEFLIGALVSIVFTVMAMYSGKAGVVSAGLADHMHDVVIIGGMVMSMVCLYAALVSFLGGVLDDVRLKMSGSSLRSGKGRVPFGQMHVLKFMKIFLP